MSEAFVSKPTQKATDTHTHTHTRTRTVLICLWRLPVSLARLGKPSITKALLPFSALFHFLLCSFFFPPALLSMFVIQVVCFPYWRVEIVYAMLSQAWPESRHLNALRKTCYAVPEAPLERPLLNCFLTLGYDLERTGIMEEFISKTIKCHDV